MKAKELDCQDAGKFAWFAARDAKMRSAVNASRFSLEQKIRADRVKLALEIVYDAEEVTIDFCQKWIRVKVHNAVIRDRKELRNLEAQWDVQGYQKRLTKQGFIYRVM